MEKQKISINAFRAQFPILKKTINDHLLIYLDNAATTQKPQSVIDTLCFYYQNINANVHRGNHQLSNFATCAFEQSRHIVKTFINARSEKQIIWTKGTTEGLNLLANSLGCQLTKGDEIIISSLEHHANIVPWQMLAKRTGIILKVIPLTEDQTIDMTCFEHLLTTKTKVVSISHVSNALGIINPVKKIIALSHAKGAQVIIDGAQAIAHLYVDVQALDCDYYVFSGHKIFAPTGIGVLYGKKHLLEALAPWQGGGEMINEVTFEETKYNQLPFKFEAGTPNISGAIALASAINFINSYDRQVLQENENKVMKFTENALQAIPEITIFARKQPKCGSISFSVAGEHHSDIAMMLDAQGIAVRSGRHCAMPLFQALNSKGSIRVSFAIYNTLDEAKSFINALNKIITLLKT
ncbi:MAG: cysteine desulfurase [Psychromonas sp.]|nr:cysteine desulfurase [Psychromonas sp.]